MSEQSNIKKLQETVDRRRENPMDINLPELEANTKEFSDKLRQYESQLAFNTFIEKYNWSNDQIYCADTAWKAATEEANKRIAELDGEVAEFKAQKVRHDQLVDYLKCGIAEELEQRILELQSSNNTLREALEKLVDMCVTHIGADYSDEIHMRYMLGKQALVATPAESLQAHDDEVIERCAQICFSDGSKFAWELAEKIMALKGK